MELELIRTLLWTIGGLAAVLIGLIGWIGVRIHSRLDSISQSLTKIERDLSKEIAIHETKLAVLYSRCSRLHGALDS